MVNRKEDKINYCETCRFRTEAGTCNSRKLIEDRPSLGFAGITKDEKRSLLIYPFSGKGAPWVGEKFGCIHHEAVDVTIAVNRLLEEIDKLHALSMQVLEEVKKSRKERVPRSGYEAGIKAQREATKWYQDRLDKMVKESAAYLKWKGDGMLDLWLISKAKTGEKSRTFNYCDKYDAAVVAAADAESAKEIALELGDAVNIERIGKALEGTKPSVIYYMDIARVRKALW